MRQKLLRRKLWKRRRKLSKKLQRRRKLRRRRGSKVQRRRKMRRRAEKRKEIELKGGKHDTIALLQVFFHFLNKNHLDIFVN